MAITNENYPAVLNLLHALSQRQDTMRQLTSLLATPLVWRSVDGSLALPIPPAELEQLRTFLRQYLDESDTISTTLRAMLET